MISFKKERLGDLGEVFSGGTPSTKNDSFWNGNIPWITPKDLSGYSNKRIARGERNITEQGLQKSSAKLIPSGSVLMSSRAPIGYVAISSNPVTTNQGMKSIKPDPEKIDAEYLFYWIKSNLNYILGKASGSTFKELSGTSFKNLLVDLPEIKIQKQIACVLSFIDNKIECNDRINDNLLKIAEAVFNDRFSSRIRGKKKIGDYISPKRGRALLSKDAKFGSVPVVAGGLVPATFHNASNTSAPVITISASGANAGYVNLWEIPVWSSDSSFIDTNATDVPYFWYIMLETRQKEIYDAQTGSAQAHIYPRHIEEMSVGEIDEAEMVEYENTVSPFFKEIGKNNFENERLTKLRDNLLPELLNGKVDVSNIDI